MIDVHFDFDLRDVVWVIFGNHVTEAVVAKIIIIPGGYEIWVQSVDSHELILCHHASDIYRTHDDAMYNLLTLKHTELTEVRNSLIDQVKEIDAELSSVRDKLRDIENDNNKKD